MQESVVVFGSLLELMWVESRAHVEACSSRRLCRSSKAGVELGQGWTHGVWHDSASGLNRRISSDASCVIAAWRQAAPDMAGWEFDMKLKGDKAKEMWDVPALRQMERHDSLAAGADSAKDVRRRAQDHVVCH